MKKLLPSLAIAGSVALLPALAQAQTPEGPYVAIQGGVNFLMNEHVYASGFPGNASLKTSTGYAVGGAAGYAFPKTSIGAPRLELEATWRSNNVKNANYQGVKYGGIDDVSSLALMVNALYDFNTGTELYPYLGVGIGAVRGWVDSTYGDISDTAFGYQGIAGLGYNITDNFGATLDYRFMRTTAWKDNGLKYRYNTNHTVMVGLRYAFGTPPAPVAPPPVVREEVVAVPDSYMVFFDFDRSVVTPEAAGIISQAAANARTQATTFIEVTGHTDTVGSQKYNMGLSKRRADSVAAELERNGISRSMISIFAKGKMEPLVATGDGVKEPQNRRVVIVLK